jgi:hypothetical protein
MPTNTPPIAERTGETGDAGSFIPVNNRMEADHGQLKRRLRPMRGLKTDQSARIIIAGHAFPEHPPRPLRAWRRRTDDLAGDECLRRAGSGNPTDPRINDLPFLGFAKCNNASMVPEGPIPS